MSRAGARALAAAAAIAGAVVSVGACSDEERPPASTSTTTEALEVNIQITGASHLRPAIAELDARDRRATIWLTVAEVDAECDYVRELSARGYEIAGMYPEEITATLSLENQRAVVSALSASVRRCSAAGMVGFRAKKFTANADTYSVLTEQAVTYLERSARAEAYSIYTFKPYLFGATKLAILPMPILVSFGQVSSLCDTASEDMMKSTELVAYERVAIEQHLKTLEPLALEWHTDTAYPGDPGGYFGAYTAVLDYLMSKGSSVRFVTAASLVTRYAPTSSGCNLCNQSTR